MIFEKVKEVLIAQFGVEDDAITMDTSFKDDLGADSLDLVDISMALEEEFDLDEVGEEDISNIKTVGDLVRYLQNRVDE